MNDSAARRRLSPSDFIGGVVHGVEGAALLNIRGERHHGFVATVEEKALYVGINTRTHTHTHTHTQTDRHTYTHNTTHTHIHTHTHTHKHTHTNLLAAVPVHI
jgi:hypothetical protein